MINNYSVKVLDSMNKEDWDKFVYNHPHGNVFHTSEMAEVYKRTKNYEPISLAVVDERSEEIFAILQAVLIKETKGFLGSFSSRAIIFGGPLFIDSKKGLEAVKILMEYYDRIAKKRAIYTEIRNMWDTSEISNFLTDIECVYEERLNFLIDLNLPINELWGRLSKPRRNNINRAKRRGVIVDEVDNEDAIPAVYRLLKEAYTNAKLPFPDISLFKSLFDISKPKNMAKFFIANWGDTCIGTMVILTCKDTIFDWYAGAPRRCSRLCPNDILAWHAIEWGSKKGYTTFDFGGAGKPNEEYGVREFKRQFGGKLVNFGRYTKIHSPIKMSIAEKGFKLYKKLCLR